MAVGAAMLQSDGDVSTTYLKDDMALPSACEQRYAHASQSATVQRPCTKVFANTFPSTSETAIVDDELFCGCKKGTQSILSNCNCSTCSTSTSEIYLSELFSAAPGNPRGIPSPNPSLYTIPSTFVPSRTSPHPRLSQGHEVNGNSTARSNEALAVAVSGQVQVADLEEINGESERTVLAVSASKVVVVEEVFSSRMRLANIFTISNEVGSITPSGIHFLCFIYDGIISA